MIEIDQTSSPAREAGMILQRAFETEGRDDADKFIEYAEQEGFETEYEGDLVKVEGPHQDVKEFVNNSEYRHLVGAEEVEMNELYRGDLTSYSGDEAVAADGGTSEGTMAEVDHTHPKYESSEVQKMFE